MIAIRLKKTGTKNRKQWRIIVSDSSVSRNGRAIDEIGHYDPTVDPPDVKIQRERYKEWVRKGARPSNTVRSLIKKLKGAVSAN